MKKTLAAFFIIFLINAPLQAKTAKDYFAEAQTGLCKTLIEKEGEVALESCATLMLEDSEKQLTQRLAEIMAKLKEINIPEATKGFLKEQKSWQNYKKNRCAYLTSETEPSSQAYSFHYRLCQSIENYRRIETLQGDPPGFP